MARIVFGPTLDASYIAEAPIPGPAPQPPTPKRDAQFTFVSATQIDGGIECRLSVEPVADGVVRPVLIHVVTETGNVDLSVDPAAYLSYAAPIASAQVDMEAAEVVVVAKPPRHPGNNETVPVKLVTLLEFAD